MKKLALVLALTALTSTAFAAGDVAKDRQDMMKNVGAAIGVGAKMAKGEMEFDAVTAQLVIRTMNTAALGFGALFPEGSETGAETEAAPAIWSDRAGFDAAVAKFAADTSGAGGIADIESFRAAFGKAAANCGSCHKAYRVKNN